MAKISFHLNLTFEKSRLSTHDRIGIMNKIVEALKHESESGAGLGPVGSNLMTDAITLIDEDGKNVSCDLRKVEAEVVCNF